MKKILFLCIIYSHFLCSCNNNGTGLNATGTDTTQILTQVFSSQKLLESIPSTIHTISLIKSKKIPYYNNSWPGNAGKLNIIYVDETPKNTEKPHFGSKLTDPPIRYVITKFSIKADSANVNLYGINFMTDYYYKLIKKDDKWQITWSNWAIE
jgi:hypothetical protein